MTTYHTRRWLLSALAGGLLAAVPCTAAHATTVVTLEHDVVGSTHIAAPDSDVALGPTTLHTDLDVDTGDFTASLPLPGTTSEFALAGFIPVKAHVDFVPAAPVQGHLDFVGSDIKVTSTAQYYVKLSDIKIAGFPTFTGPNCRTVDPVTIPANTPADGVFDLINGGELEGTYSIGDFQNCGLNTWLINAVVPGDDNTLDLQVSNGRILD